MTAVDGNAFTAALTAEWPGLETGTMAEGTPWARVPSAQLLTFLSWLQARGYRRFLDITVVDAPERSDRFEVQYLFYAMAERRWFRVKARTSEVVPTITPLFAGADWYEREAFDLFGVRFAGHPDLRRILLPDDFNGHPLCADHPVGSEPIDFTVTRELYGTGGPTGKGGS